MKRYLKKLLQILPRSYILEGCKCVVDDAPKQKKEIHKQFIRQGYLGEFWGRPASSNRNKFDNYTLP